MGDLGFKELLNEIRSNEENFKELKRKFEDKAGEIEAADKEIAELENKIAESEKQIRSVGDLKKSLIDEASAEFKNKNQDNDNWFSSAKREIEDDISRKGKEAEAEIQRKYSEKNSINDSELKESEQGLENIRKLVSFSEQECTELDNIIKYSTEESSQVKLCIPKIEPDYANVPANEGFKIDEADPRGATPEDADKKFSALSDKKLVKISKRMNSGAYVSSPDESPGIPVLEILLNTLSFLGNFAKKLLKGISLLYKPAKITRNIKFKLIYGAVITFILFLVVIMLSSVIGPILLFLIICAVIAFVGMLGYNLFKFSNKAYRKEMNLEYYAVGYYFNHKKNEILYRLALIYYNTLKAKFPDELQSIIQEEYGNLQSKKDKAEENLTRNRQQLELFEKSCDDARQKHKITKSQLEIECRTEKENSSAGLAQESKERLSELEAKYQENKTSIQAAKEQKEKNSEKEAIDTVSKVEQEIASYNAKRNECKTRKAHLLSEKDDIIKEIEAAEKKNRSNIQGLEDAEIIAVDKRSTNDEVSDSFFAGVVKDTEESCIDIDGRKHSIYKIQKITHNKKPIFVVFDGIDEESNTVTVKYYKFINSIICNMLAETYMGAYKFVLLDSQSTKTSIVKSMTNLKEAFDDLEKNEIIQINTGRTDKEISDILSERESELDGKNIEEINKSNKNLDTMTRYLVLSIRVYGKKSGDFSMSEIWKRLNSCVDNGIIPIILMSKDYFEESQDNIQLPIKELCGGSYYVWDLDATDNFEISIMKSKI